MARALWPITFALSGFLLIYSIAGGQTPSGLPHVLQVFDRQGQNPARDGSIVYLGRVFTREERAQLEQERRTPGFCSTSTVQGGSVLITPQFTTDCPEGSVITAVLDLRDGRGLIAAQVTPQIEWRRAQPGEASRSVAVRPILPRTGGEDAQAQMLPPSTGDGAAATANTDSVHPSYVAFGAAVILAVASLSLVLLLKRRPQAHSGI
jgi:hypothetical protein